MKWKIKSVIAVGITVLIGVGCLSANAKPTKHKSVKNSSECSGLYVGKTFTEEASWMRKNVWSIVGLDKESRMVSLKVVYDSGRSEVMETTCAGAKEAISSLGL